MGIWDISFESGLGTIHENSPPGVTGYMSKPSDPDIGALQSAIKGLGFECGPMNMC